jgi:hypothetical protein
MENKKINNSFSCSDNSIHSQSQVKYSSPEQKLEAFNRAYDEGSTFYEVFADVKCRVDFDCFSPAERDNAEDICLIITEVLKLPPDALIRIAGNNLPAEMVQAIYHRLTHEHIELVMENFGRATYEIKHKKTYLRTALYNSVFEINAHYENAVKSDYPQMVKDPFGTRRGE